MDDANGLEDDQRMEPKEKASPDVAHPRATRGFRSTGQLETGIGADRVTTERLLLAIGARKSRDAEEWTLRAAEGV